jgi:hypothetical protein
MELRPHRNAPKAARKGVRRMSKSFGFPEKQAKRDWRVSWSRAPSSIAERMALSSANRHAHTFRNFCRPISKTEVFISFQTRSLLINKFAHGSPDVKPSVPPSITYSTPECPGAPRGSDAPRITRSRKAASTC